MFRDNAVKLLSLPRMSSLANSDMYKIIDIWRPPPIQPVNYDNDKVNFKPNVSIDCTQPVSNLAIKR